MKNLIRYGDKDVELRGVSKAYPGTGVILKDINLSINKGEFVLIVGPTGSGKTTLLRHIYIDELPTKGKVEIFGRVTQYLKRKEVSFMRRKIGVIFQDFKLIEDRTVFDNVSFALEVLGETRRYSLIKTQRILKELGISSKAGYLPHHLSGGEAQRVAIARALVREPFLLLADEPTGSLDEKTAIEIIEILKEVSRWGTTIIMATHNKEFTSIIDGARIISLRDGKVREGLN